jgi:hypothetical protein
MIDMLYCKADTKATPVSVQGVDFWIGMDFASPQRCETFTQPPIQWEPGALSLGVKRPGREADHSPPSSAEVKEGVELYPLYPNSPFWRGAQLKHRDICTLPHTNRSGIAHSVQRLFTGWTIG